MKTRWFKGVRLTNCFSLSCLGKGYRPGRGISLTRNVCEEQRACTGEQGCLIESENISKQIYNIWPHTVMASLWACLSVRCSCRRGVIRAFFHPTLRRCLFVVSVGSYRPAGLSKAFPKQPLHLILILIHNQQQNMQQNGPTHML